MSVTGRFQLLRSATNRAACLGCLGTCIITMRLPGPILSGVGEWWSIRWATPAAVAWPTTKRQSRIGVVAGLALSAFEPDEVEQVQGVGVPPAQLLSWTQTLGGPALAMCQLMETADGTTCKTRVRGDSCCAGIHGTVVRFRSGREQFCVSSNCDFPSALKWCGLAQVIRGPNRRLFRHP